MSMGAHYHQHRKTNGRQRLAHYKPQRTVLLTDCMGPVDGFQLQHEMFLQDMQRHGLELASSQDFWM